MKKKETQQPSDLEMQVLSVLWDEGPMTVRQIRESLPDGKSRAYTTVLTVLQVMEKKGLVEHEPDGVRHIYKPTVGRSKVLRPLLRNLVRNVFGGSPAVAMQHLISETDVSEEDVREIRQLLDAVDAGKE